MKKELEKILNSTHDAMIAVDKKGVITLFNKAAEELTRKISEQVVGKPVTSVIANTRLPYVLRSGESEVNRRQKIGDIEIITSRFPILDEGEIIGATAIFRDVSEMVKLAEELTNTKELQMTMQAVFNATQDAISVVDKNGIHILINPAYTSIMGYGASEVLGRDYNVDIERGNSVHEEVLKTGKSVEKVVLRSGKMKKDVVTSAAPILVDGKIMGSVAVIHDITEISRLTNELAQAKKIIRNLEAKYTFDDIIGDSLKLKDAVEKAKIAALTPATVILRGESGTGKELFAHAIHNASNRKNAQFVRVNCAAISESLLESELFGYEEGAFTGAIKGGRMGLFERASGGTIFLDEIGEISTQTQIKLLRVIQEKEIIRVGSTRSIAVDVRIISATNLDLEKAVKAGRFREDLYYRLNVIPILIPALRERINDLEELVKTIIIKFNQEYGRSVRGISQTALSRLKQYNWPGNIRELENFIGRAMIQMGMTQTIIEQRHLPNFSANKRKVKPQVTYSGENMSAYQDLAEYMADKEYRYINSVLQATGGNRTMAAQILQISVRSLYYKLEKYK